VSHDVEKLRCWIAEVPLYMLAMKKFIRYLMMLCSFILEICISPPLNLVMTHWLNNHWRWWKVNIQLKRNLEYLRKQQIWRKVVHLNHAHGKVYLIQIWHKVVHSNHAHGEVYLIQHYVIKCVSDLQQVSGFLWVLQFPPIIKLITLI
jgi:hypothetical protein